MTLIGSVGRWHGQLAGADALKQHAQEVRECTARIQQIEDEIAERKTMLKEHRKHLRALVRATDPTTRTA